MTGIGVIGAGKHGQRYLRHAHVDVPQLRVTALTRRDRDAGRAQAADLDCTFHDGWEALVDDPAVDAVVAVVPPTLHVSIARRVAAAGKALLIEKPLAPTGAEARDLIATADRAGIAALMAQTLRWNAVVGEVRRRLPDLGPLRALGITQRFEPSALDWLDRPEVSGGGIVLHTGVHSFDLVRHLTGREVGRVCCWTRATATERTEDNFVALCTLVDSDALVTVTGSRDSRGRSGLMDAAGTEGRLLADHQQHWAETGEGLDRQNVDLPPPVPTVQAVLESFVGLIERGASPPASLADGARAVLVAEACVRSAREGRAVDVEPL